jgi:hypothetical protein
MQVRSGSWRREAARKPGLVGGSHVDRVGTAGWRAAWCSRSAVVIGALTSVIAFVMLSSVSYAYVGVAYLQFSSQNPRGTFMNLSTRGLEAYNWTADWDVIGSWVITPDYYYIDAGIYSGNIQTSGCDAPVIPSNRFFWADSRPFGGGYHCHTSSDYVATGQNYGTTIYSNGGGNWSVGVGPLSGTSSNSIGPPNLIESGTDMSNSQSYSCSASSQMTWDYSGGGLHEGWYSGSNYGGLTQSRPPYAAWQDPVSSNYPGQTWLRHWTTYCY